MNTIKKPDVKRWTLWSEKVRKTAERLCEAVETSINPKIIKPGITIRSDGYFGLAGKTREQLEELKINPMIEFFPGIHLDKKQAKIVIGLLAEGKIQPNTSYLLGSEENILLSVTNGKLFLGPKPKTGISGMDAKLFENLYANSWDWGGERKKKFDITMTQQIPVMSEGMMMGGDACLDSLHLYTEGYKEKAAQLFSSSEKILQFLAFRNNLESISVVQNEDPLKYVKQLDQNSWEIPMELLLRAALDDKKFVEAATLLCPPKQILLPLIKVRGENSKLRMLPVASEKGGCIPYKIGGYVIIWGVAEIGKDVCFKVRASSPFVYKNWDKCEAEILDWVSHKPSVVQANTKIDDGCEFGYEFEASGTIGKNVHVGENVKISGQVGEGVTIGNGSFVMGIVGNEVKIGEYVLMQDHLTIGDGATIGAWSNFMESQTIPANTVIKAGGLHGNLIPYI